MNLRIIFMGTQGLAEVILEGLIQSKTYKPFLVISQPDKRIGRKQLIQPVAVKVLAQKHNIESWQPSNLKDKEVIHRVASYKPDCIIVASYGKIIPQEIISIPKYGILNVHASLLPRYRGASPIQRAILNGDTQTGVTIMKIDSGLDTGDVLSQEIYNITKNETTTTLTDKLANLGSALLLKTLPDWINGTIIPKKQDNASASIAHLFTKEDGFVLQSYDVTHIERMMRALYPWPGVYITLKNGQNILLKKIHATPCLHKTTPLHTFIMQDKQLQYHTNGGCMVLDEIQPEGKKSMSGYNFYLGNTKNLC